LLWIDLVDWWKSQSGETLEQDAKRNLYVRLLASLQSEPEKKLFDRYFRLFTSEFENKLPALIPQVYLHYDPKTIRELAGEKRLPRQRMDFLLLFSNYERIVIEVDGKQHYSDNEGKATPQLYAEMVAEDRRLRLSGYEVYRFGAYELNGNNADTLIENFFRQLFKKYSIAP
jgi:very-short-patch-repair endonuclease